MRTLISVVVLLALPVSGFAEYTVTEVIVIPWGDGANELQIWEPDTQYNEGPIPDTVGHLEASGGPDKTFVDPDENFYFMSYSISYLKGFDNSGNVIVDYSQGKTEFNYDFFAGMFINFYVDSLGYIYCGGDGIFHPYVAVVDTDNNLLDRLNPLGVNSGIGCSLLDWGSNDVLLLNSFEHGYYTYMNGEFIHGGSTGWRAADGYYYKSKKADSSSFHIFRYSDPDSLGYFVADDTLVINFEFDDLKAGGLFCLDDSLNFYIDYTDSSGVYDGLRIYDQNLTLLDDIQYLPRQENRYLWDTPYPFIRHDGNVYEFHCRDDGMHVFRWTKQ